MSSSRIFHNIFLSPLRTFPLSSLLPAHNARSPHHSFLPTCPLFHPSLSKPSATPIPLSYALSLSCQPSTSYHPLPLDEAITHARSQRSLSTTRRSRNMKTTTAEEEKKHENEREFPACIYKFLPPLPQFPSCPCRHKTHTAFRYIKSLSIPFQKILAKKNTQFSTNLSSSHCRFDFRVSLQHIFNKQAIPAHPPSYNEPSHPPSPHL